MGDEIVIPAQGGPAPAAPAAPAPGALAPGAPAAPPPAPTMPDWVNGLVKTNRKEAKENALKEVAEILGTSDPEALKKIAEALKVKSSENGSSEEDYKRTIAELTKANQTNVDKIAELTNNQTDSANRLTVSGIVNQLGPHTAKHGEAVIAEFFRDFDLKSGLVHKKGSETPLMSQDGAKALTPSDIVQSYKAGDFKSFFGESSKLTHIEGQGDGTDKKNYKPTKEDLMNPAFTKALRDTNQTQKAFTGEGLVDLTRIEKVMDIKK